VMSKPMYCQLWILVRSSKHYTSKPNWNVSFSTTCQAQFCCLACTFLFALNSGL
jgi:hypothetical protein